MTIYAAVTDPNSVRQVSFRWNNLGSEVNEIPACNSGEATRPRVLHDHVAEWAAAWRTRDRSTR